jgi:hypothetical protein
VAAWGKGQRLTLEGVSIQHLCPQIHIIPWEQGEEVPDGTGGNTHDVRDVQIQASHRIVPARHHGKRGGSDGKD